jgi:hypothetical protein
MSSGPSPLPNAHTIGILQAGSIDLVLMGRKITELSKDELLALDAMFTSMGAVGAEQQDQEALH